MCLRSGLYNKISKLNKLIQNQSRQLGKSAKDGENNVVSQLINSIGQTTVLVQQGCNIQELPTTLRKFRPEDLLSRSALAPDTTAFEINDTSFLNPSTPSTEELILCLKNASATVNILRTINSIPYNHLAAEIAATALERLLQFEALIGLQNLEDGSLVYNNIVQCVIEKGETRMILDFLETLKAYPDLKKTIQRLCDELLLRNSDGMLNIVEICECIEIFTDCKQHSAVERLWTGIADNEENINDMNIKFVYKILPHLKITQRLIIGILERRILDVWLHLKPMTVVSSLRALSKANLAPHRTMHCFARWLNTNTHAVSDLEMKTIIQEFTKLNFSNTEIEKALERYIKAKSTHVRQEPIFIATLKHAKKFRLHNEHILMGCTEFFIKNSKKVSRIFFHSLLTTMGTLNYRPTDQSQFWINAQNYLNRNFSKIHPRIVIEVLLNFCYLEKFPIAISSTIFNPDYLNILESSVTKDDWKKIRNELKLLDMTLALESSKNYLGPILAVERKDELISLDGRIERTINDLEKYLGEIVGDGKSYTKMVKLDKLPDDQIYIVDIKIDGPECEGGNVAVLIQLPEYYDASGKVLNGKQTMRIRHLKKLGMQIATIDCEKVTKLRESPKQLRQYLSERLERKY